MARKKTGLQSHTGKVVMNFIYGAAAAVVIVGALFKILHWTGANEMLIIGMFTEAFVFLVSAFDAPEEGYEWERVYPALADESYEPGENLIDTDWTKDVSKIDGSVFGDLSDTLLGLNDNVSKLSSVTDAAGATNDIQQKSKKLQVKLIH